MEKVKLTRELRVLALAVLAGMAIGIGGVLYLTLENKVVGALMFTVGLYAICAHGLNLFTGKVGYLVNKPVSDNSFRNLGWKSVRYISGGICCAADSY